jgi:hypothetical protein
MFWVQIQPPPPLTLLIVHVTIISMKTSYDALAGTVDLNEAAQYHNPDFGYTLFEEVVDPANPEGPRAIAMHVPPHSLSKVWQLVEPGYQETVELLIGSASLVVNRSGTEDWTTMPMDMENPTADDVEIAAGDMFCVVTHEDDAVLLSRPSKHFDKSFEVGVTKSPEDALSQFIVAHTASI